MTDIEKNSAANNEADAPIIDQNAADVKSGTDGGREITEPQMTDGASDNEDLKSNPTPDQKQYNDISVALDAAIYEPEMFALPYLEDEMRAGELSSQQNNDASETSDDVSLNQISLFDESEDKNFLPEVNTIPPFIPSSPKSGRVARRDVYNPERPRRADTVFDFVELVIFSFVIIMLLGAFIFRQTVVEGESMMGTLMDGEHLIVSSMFYTPERGDIVVVHCPTYNGGTAIVKRIIGIEGDHIAIKSDGRIYVNDELLEEDYVYIDNPLYRYYPLDTYVGKDSIFVMGDHRNNSYDSRNFDTLSTNNIIGKVLLRVYPFDKFGAVN